MKANTNSKPSFVDRMLSVIEKGCNKLPSPFTMFIELFLIVAVLSAIFSSLNVTVTNPSNEELVTVNNFLSKEGLTWFLSNMTTNFSGFASLGLVLSMTMGISVCEQVGLVDSILKKSVRNVSASAIPYVIAFIGTCGNIASDTCTVVIPPLAAIAFMGVGRNPIAGLMCGWLAANCGFSANLLIAGTDSLLAGITNTSIQVLLGTETDFQVDSSCNWFFIIASTFLITFLIGWCTNHLLEKKVSVYTGEMIDIRQELTAKQNKALRNTGLALLIYIIIIIAAVASGLLLNPETGSIINSPFLKGLIPILLIMFLLCGIVYGYSIGVFKNEKDVTKAISKAMSSMGSFVAFCFAAGQFTALFNWTHLGTVIAVSGANLIKNLNCPDFILFVCIVLLVIIVNLFMGSASAKWTIFGPILVPMLMMLNFHPAWTQLLYRIGDSPSNAISPLSPYLFMCLAVINEKYDKDMKLGSFITPCLPTITIVQISWIIFALVWYLIGLPLGPGVTAIMP